MINGMAIFLMIFLPKKKKRSPIPLVVIFPGNHFWDGRLVGSTMGLDHAHADSHHNS